MDKNTVEYMRQKITEHDRLMRQITILRDGVRKVTEQAVAFYCSPCSSGGPSEVVLSALHLNGDSWQNIQDAATDAIVAAAEKEIAALEAQLVAL